MTPAAALLGSWLLPLAAGAPCTDADALHHPGSWARGTDDVAMGDPSFPKSGRAAMWRKADAAAELLQQAIPSPPGLEAKLQRAQRGRPYAKDGPVPFGVVAHLLAYYCVPDTPSYPQLRGTLQPGGETETWIYIDFNSLNWLAHESLLADKELRAPGGAGIFYQPARGGELAGQRLWLPTVDRTKSEALVFTPDGRDPYRPLSREAYVEARLRRLQGQLDEADKKQREVETTHAKQAQSLTTMKVSAEQKAQIIAAAEKGYQSAVEGLQRHKGELETDRAKLVAARDALTADERAAPAFVRDVYAMPDKGLFADEAQGGRPLVTVDPELFLARGPRDVIRVITVYWKWDPKHAAKAEAIDRLREHFDFAALEAMLGK